MGQPWPQPDAKVIPLRPFKVTRCTFCDAPWSSSVTLTITAAGAYCTNRTACAERQAAHHG